MAKEMKMKGFKVVNFGAGEPDFDTPDEIKNEAISAIRGGMTKYTAVAGTPELRKAICRKFEQDQGVRYQPGQIVVSSGAKHSIYNAVQVLVQAGDEVILPAPYWVSYLEQIKLAGADVRIVATSEEKGFKLTPGLLAAAATPRTRLLILNSPGNPTGAVYSRQELELLAEVILKHDGLMVISDEIYEKLIYDGLKHVSIASLSAEMKERTVIINGVSKAYAMTGWRIGYAAAAEPVAKAMADLQSHSTSNAVSVSQEAARVALSSDLEAVGQMVAEFARRRDYMLERLQAIPGISCTRPGGAFYLFPNVKSFFGGSYQGKKINHATDLAAVLLADKKVAVVPGIAFGNDDYIRLSYACAMEDIREGMDRFTAFLASVNYNFSNKSRV
ncbi:MAG: Aspartate/tyrosine/aromatic aminotransferase, partial [Pelotomaculum thermopropionicum]